MVSNNQVVTFESSMPVLAEALFAWHKRPGAFVRLRPPWIDLSVSRYEGIQDGKVATLHLGKRPFQITWQAEHQDYVEGHQFRDIQRKGPFKHWVHTHKFLSRGHGISRLIDHIEYALPFGLNPGILKNQLAKQFAYRHRITRQDLAAHQRYNPEQISLRIAITGASGLVGSNLSAFLSTGGHQVYRLVRTLTNAPDEIYWNPVLKEIERDRLEGMDAVIHLAGENIFSLRWSQQKKERIYQSRVQGTKFLGQTLAQLSKPPTVFLSSSAIGYYGNRGEEPLSENADPGSGFLARVCTDWEGATALAQEAGIRTALMRIGIVLTPQSGMLRKMLLPFRLGLGGRLGGQDQYLSWITLDDVILGIYHSLMTNTVRGPINMVSANPVRMQTFVKTLAQVLKRPAFLHVPASLLRLAMGQVAEETALTSTRVYPQKLRLSAYDFLYTDLEVALRHMLGR